MTVGRRKNDDEEEEKEEITAPANDAGNGMVEENGHTTNCRDGLPQQKQPSMLPEVTPEIVEEHEAQVAATSRTYTSASTDGETPQKTHWGILCPSNNDDHGEPAAICGIPYYLFMTLAALIAAVTAGTIFAVVYYDPDDGIQPPSYPPTPVPTSESTNISTLSDAP